MANESRQEWIEQRVSVLGASTDPAELETAATQLAAADDPDALQRLREFLSRRDFLARLDDHSEPGQKTMHLHTVMAPLIERPSPEVADLCLKLSEDPAFLEDDDRQTFLLDALARVTPMTAPTVEFFQRTNDEGYFAMNAPRLAANGSPLALELFASMMSDREVPWERRVDLLHMSIVPYRTRLAMLELSGKLLGEDLEQPVATGVIESVFDYNWQWFGSHPPPPPAWRSAADAVLRYLIDLGARAKRRPHLAEPLQQSVDATVELARALLKRRAG
jgi:hypothetical protein